MYKYSKFKRVGVKEEGKEEGRERQGKEGRIERWGIHKGSLCMEQLLTR